MEHRGEERTDLNLDLSQPRQAFVILSQVSIWACIVEYR